MHNFEWKSHHDPWKILLYLNCTGPTTHKFNCLNTRATGPSETLLNCSTAGHGADDSQIKRPNFNTPMHFLKWYNPANNALLWKDSTKIISQMNKFHLNCLKTGHGANDPQVLPGLNTGHGPTTHKFYLNCLNTGHGADDSQILP